MNNFDDGRSNGDSKLDRAINSTLAIAFNRFGVPAMIAVIGWFIMQGVGEIREENKTAREQRDEQQKDITIIKSDVRDLNTVLHGQVLMQVTTNTTNIATETMQIAELRGRIEMLENHRSMRQ